MKLSGNTILITGGASGIGLGLAEALVKLNNKVIVASRSAEKLKAAGDKGIQTFELDLLDTDRIGQAAQKLTNNFPNLNAVIHSAGIMKNENLLNGDNARTICDTVFTNILGTMLLDDALIPHFKNQSTATIMTVTSGLAFAPFTMTPTYCASKAAIHSYTQSLRHQLKDTKIQVIELIPPYVRTSLMGPRQASDENAMPLNDFINEVIQILTSQPNVKEVVVERVKAQRTVSDQGPEKYDAFFQQMNDRLWNIRKDEFPK